MPKPLSKEMREAIIYHKQNRAKNKEIAKWLLINEKSVKRIWKKYKEEKTVEVPAYKRGRKAAFCDTTLNKIIEKIGEQPDITLEELVKLYSLNISISALSRKLTKLELTFKKRRYFVKNNSVLMSNGCAANG